MESVIQSILNADIISWTALISRFVRVVGKIKKGDRLVAAGNGLAKSGSKSEITPWNVIGRSLENKQDDGVGTVEAIVKLNS